ncbi:NAD(P)H-binding protein [Streptomyces sp. NPDC051217]|uniref:NAD(P)H-binding protein n=1 Tax=Streptomyces sp. NPDC051217 TaxID=3365644 RepID=UPI0037AFC5C9
MRIVIAGGHGRIALGLERILVGRHDQVVGLIRNPDHAADVSAAGASPELIDLETAVPGALAGVLAGADVAVFAAGAGGKGGPARTTAVDGFGAVRFADAAQTMGVRRFVLLSSMGADASHPGEDGFAHYLRIKGAADDAVRVREALEWTVLRPGWLTDDPASGTVDLTSPPGPLAASPAEGGIPRADVAALLAEIAHTPNTAGLTLGAVSGSTPTADAVRTIAPR